MYTPLKQDNQQKVSTSEFAQDVYDFLSGRRAGHMSKWLYSQAQYEGDKACGVTAWARVARESKNGSPYYIFRAEEEIIRKATAQVAHLAGNKTRIIDLGPGSLDALRSKVLPVINAVGDSVQEYVVVDVSKQSIDAAQKEINSILPFLKTNGVNGDFLQDGFNFGRPIDTEIAVLFGLTLCNLPIDPLVKGLPERMLTASLKRLKTRFTGTQGYLIITQDTNQDIETLEKAYATRKPVYMTLPHLIARDLSIHGNFNPDGFDLNIDFNPETQACAMSLVANENMDFSVDGYQFYIQKGKPLYFHNAFKFDEETFLRASVAAGLDYAYTEKDSGNPCLLHILRWSQAKQV